MKRSKEVRDHHINEAKRWLSLGHGENMEMDVDTELPPILQQRDAMLRDINQNWMEASDQHNPKEMEQLSRAFERLCRIGGHESHKF